jgi:hypothetical protein
MRERATVVQQGALHPLLPPPVSTPAPSQPLDVVSVTESESPSGVISPSALLIIDFKPPLAMGGL